MRIPIVSLLVIVTLLPYSFCFDLKCIDFSMLGVFDDYPERCHVLHLVITSPNDTITSVNGNTDPDSLQAYTELKIRNQVVTFIPKNIATFFPILETLEISNSNLEWIEQANIRELTSLRELNLDKNNLAILALDLFDFNTELTHISVRENKLQFVHENIFYRLTKLNEIYLEQNLCTESSSYYNDYYNYASYFKNNAYTNRAKVREFLRSKCQSWENAYNIYMTMSRNWINYLQSESETQIETLAHQLKTCDGNLDAALMNFHQQKLTTSMVATNKSDVSIDLRCESKVCVAIDFKFPFANLFIEGELHKTQLIQSLKIHQQQTLFLPQNLDDNFPELLELSVTDSGLYEINFSVFVGLNLSSLNLTNNKIPEIPVDTFAYMNNLHILDLSFNKIHSLFDDVFATMKSLRQLRLNNNYLTSIRVDVVRNLESLNNLYLEGNQLKFISATLLTPFTSLETVDLSDNVCINMSHPTTSLVDIETAIIDNCIAPVELSCKFYLIESSEIDQNTSYCNVEDLIIEYPKTKISMLRNTEQGINESVKIFFVYRQSIKFFPFKLSEQFSNLERIEIQQSNLTALHSMDFFGFFKLTEIVIVNNNISSISAGTFDIVPQLELLDLSSNGISTLPRNIFARLTRLHTLILSHNHMVTFMANILPRRNVLQLFEVNNNQLEFIETKTIRYLRKAKLIDLTGNVCVDMQFVETANKTRALVELSGEIDLNCSADD